MENANVNVPETRSRSRSKTPMLTLRVSVDRDDETQKKTSKNPSVVTIVEEAEPSASPAVRTTRGALKARAATSDYSSEDVSPDSSQTSQPQQTQVQPQAQQNNSKKITVTTTTISSSSTSSSSVIVNNTNSNSASSSSETVTKVSKSGDDKIKEINQNEINKKLEDAQGSKIHTSTPNSTSKLSKKFSAKQNNYNEQEHIAYQVYKDAGEYWNATPKTDYTYSVMSPCRREIVPGVIAMPNMSRKSLEKHQDRVTQMVHENPSNEKYIRSRYQVNKNLNYDSADEMDLSQFDKRSRSTRSTTHVESNNIIKRFFLSIVTFFYSSAHSVSRIFYKSEHDLYYKRVHEEQGIFSRIISGTRNLFLGIFRRIYMLITTVLFLDSWLLQPKASSGESSSRKRFLLLLLVLLPILGFGAWHLADEEQRAVMRRALPSAVPLVAATINKYLALPNFNLQFFPDTFQTQSSTSQYYRDNLKDKLNDAEYRNLIVHIESYVDKLMLERAAAAANSATSSSRQQTLTPEMEQLIARIIQENLSNYKYQLTDADFDKIAARVKSNLENYFTTEMHTTINNYEYKLSGANMDEIRKLIKSEINLHKTEFTVNNQEIDLDDILAKILGSASLTSLIDERIAMKSQSSELDQFRLDFETFKMNVELSLNTQKADANVNLDALRSDHQRLSEEFAKLQLGRQDELERILAEVDAKILSSEEKQMLLLDDRIRNILIDVFDYKGAGRDNVDIRNWIKSIFMAKEELENRLNVLTENSNNHVVDEVKNSANILMLDISKRIKEEVILQAAKSSDKASLDGTVGIDVGSSLTTDDVKRLVKEALAVYDADKTGLVDYALETAGGQILSTRCTESYQAKSAQISIFGIPLWYPTNTPRVAITPSVQPGQCWAFQGFPGFLVIQLNSAVYISGFTIEHIPQLLSPNGNIDSAPKEFSVWGLISETDQEPVLFGKYEYVQNSTSLQFFPVQNKDLLEPYQVVELRIESNHGNPNYTCLYRFRVHGKPNK